jgi:RNA polymerase sigma-70 factor, ECF subfamily
VEKKMTDGDVYRSVTVDVTSSSLLVRVKSLNQAAWERLIGLYNPLVYRWCRRSQLQGPDAIDIGQEVFAAVFRKIGEFQHGRPGSFRKWLRTITRNKVTDFLRRQQRHVEAAGGSSALMRLQEVPEEVNDDGDIVPAKVDKAILFQRALQLVQCEFEERTWQAFWRVIVEDEKPAAVAKELAMSRNAVYLAKSRIIRRLREEYSELLDPEDL